MHNHHLVPLDVALDEVEPFEPGEKFAAAAHFGSEGRVGLSAAVVHEVLPRAEVARLACRVVAHGYLPGFGAERVGEDLDVAAAAQVALQHAADRLYGLHGVDPPFGTREAGDRPGVVAEVGTDVDAGVAPPDKPAEVVDILRGGGVAADAEPLPDEEHPAYGAQVALERQRAVEDSVYECLHGGRVSLCSLPPR